MVSCLISVKYNLLLINKTAQTRKRFIILPEVLSLEVLESTEWQPLFPSSHYPRALLPNHEPEVRGLGCAQVTLCCELAADVCEPGRNKNVKKDEKVTRKDAIIIEKEREREKKI